MITEAQVRYWQRHRRYPEIADRLDRRRDPIGYDEWCAIEQASADLAMIGRGILAPEFEARILAGLVEAFSPEAVDLLRSDAAT